MKKKKNQPKLTIKSIHDPYRNGDEKFSEIVEKYNNDANAIVDIDDITYYRALWVYLFEFRKNTVIAMLDNKMGRKTGDILIDENDNLYTVKGFAMISFRSDIPDWYLKFSFTELIGTPENVGMYFAKKPS